MSVQVFVDDRNDLYVLWPSHGAYQHLRQDGQHTEHFELPSGLERIYPVSALIAEYALEDEYERGYERGYEVGYDAGQEQGYDAGLDAGRDW